LRDLQENKGPLRNLRDLNFRDLPKYLRDLPIHLRDLQEIKGPLRNLRDLNLRDLPKI
jgi:hypothetical protein